MAPNADSCAGFNVCAGGSYPTSNGSSAGSTDSSHEVRMPSRIQRSINGLDMRASLRNCDKGRGPRSVSSSARRRSSFSTSPARGALLPFHAMIRCVRCLRPRTVSRISSRPLRWRRCSNSAVMPSLTAAAIEIALPFLASAANAPASSPAFPAKRKFFACSAAKARPAAVSKTSRSDEISVGGGSMDRKTSPTGAR